MYEVMNDRGKNPSGIINESLLCYINKSINMDIKRLKCSLSINHDVKNGKMKI